MRGAIYSTTNPEPSGVGSTNLRMGMGKRARYVSIGLVVRIEGYGNYSWLYGRNGQRYLMAKTLAVLARELPHFWRVHKSHLVNPAYVLGTASLVRHKSLLGLSTGETIVVARRHKKEVCSRLESIVKG